MKTIQLLGDTRTLKVPRSMTVCYEIWQAGGTNYPRALAAALGVCLVEIDPREPTVTKRYTGEVLPYGAAVMDELVAKGATPGEVMAAGAVAYGLLYDKAHPTPTEEEVAAAEAPFVGADSTSPPST
jgi:hypothetical protein